MRTHMVILEFYECEMCGRVKSVWVGLDDVDNAIEAIIDAGRDFVAMNSDGGYFDDDEPIDQSDEFRKLAKQWVNEELS